MRARSDLAISRLRHRIEKHTQTAGDDAKTDDLTQEEWSALKATVLAPV
jgi:hypothetical protein